MNKFSLALAALIIAVTLSSCASMLGDFTDRQIAQNTYEVKYSGNGFVTSQSAYENAMKRSAELTASHGYRYFEVLDKKTVLIPHENYRDYHTTIVNFPETTLKIKFVSDKTAAAYDVNSVRNQVKS